MQSGWRVLQGFHLGKGGFELIAPAVFADPSLSQRVLTYGRITLHSFLDLTRVITQVHTTSVKTYHLLRRGRPRRTAAEMLGAYVLKLRFKPFVNRDERRKAVVVNLAKGELHGPNAATPP